VPRLIVSITMKATTSGTSKSSVTSRTARTVTPSLVKKRSRTRNSRTTRSAIRNGTLLNTQTQSLRVAHSNLPPNFRLTFNESVILLYVEQHRNQAYDQWPQELKQPKAVERLRRNRYLLRGYWPTRYNITKRGYSLVKWIQSSREHVSSTAAAAA
jgi:hypothetical protein